jgi:fatty acid desaturase
VLDQAHDQLIDRDRIRAWSRRANGPGLRHLAGHLALLAMTGVLVATARDSLWVWPAMVLHGVVLVFLFTPLHECVHRTAFRDRALNETVAFIVGVLLLLPREYFRAFHFAHHRFTQDPARDPELATAKPDSIGRWLWQVSGLPYWIGQGRGLVEHAFGRAPEAFYKDARQRRAVVNEARIILVIYAGVLAASLLTGSSVALYYWLVPVLLGQPALRLYLMAEHMLCPLGPDMLENTRTTYTNAAMRFLAWNMPFHAEHHAYPAVPFHRLPEVNRAIAAQLKTTAPGYFQVQRQILGSFHRQR